MAKLVVAMLLLYTLDRPARAIHPQGVRNRLAQKNCRTEIILYAKVRFPVQSCTDMLIRSLVASDIPAVATLLHALAREYIVHESPPEGAATFLAENGEMGVRGFVARGHVYHVAVIDGELAGFVAVRDCSHLFHLFVGARWHRRGVARALWETARAAALAGGGDGSFTVNSSNFAVPVYESFGFVRVGPTQCAKGLYFNPMRLSASEAG